VVPLRASDMRRLSALIGALVLAGGVAGCHAGSLEPIQDRDHDGLDDRLEAFLAVTYLPTIHEFASGDAKDECAFPVPRPILYRARPRVWHHRVDLDDVAITYVLLYAEDCGPLGHTGDNEAFTLFLHRDRGPNRWRAVGASATAHQGTAAERLSVGAGLAIWLSRNKHSAYATFEACGVDDWIVDVCAEAGPSPPAYTFLNVGEPLAPLSNDVGDVMLAAGADPSAARTLAPWLVGSIDDRAEARLIEAMAQPRVSRRDQVNFAYLLFRGRRIWNHEPFLGAGDITAQLFLGAVILHIPEILEWDAEDPRAPGAVIR
jgi:hypothetical protein